MDMVTYNYNYPIELKNEWKKYQSEHFCIAESHAVINLLNLGLKHIEVPPLSYNNKELERFTMKFPKGLIESIDKKMKELGVNTRSKAIHLLIAKGLTVAKHNEGK